MQIFNVAVQVLVDANSKVTAQTVQDRVSGYLQDDGNFSVDNAWYVLTHAHGAREVQTLAPPAPRVQEVNYSVYYGPNGSQGALLGAGHSIHAAKIAALRTYNGESDFSCDHANTWEQMVTTLYAHGECVVTIVRTTY